MLIITKKGRNKIKLLVKTRLNSIEALISKALIEAFISHDDERSNRKSKHFNSSSKILVYL